MCIFGSKMPKTAKKGLFLALFCHILAFSAIFEKIDSPALTPLWVPGSVHCEKIRFFEISQIEKEVLEVKFKGISLFLTAYVFFMTFKAKLIQKTNQDKIKVRVKQNHHFSRVITAYIPNSATVHCFEG